MLRYILLFTFSIISVSALAQSKSDQQFIQEYQKRLTKEKIDRIYIPKDLTDAHDQLDLKMEKDAKLGFMKLSDAEAPRKYHFMLGRWLIKNWSLDRGSRLSAYLRKKGVFHPDDMAMYILQTYHRKLHFRPLQEDALLADLALKYAAEKEARKKYRSVLKTETRIRKQQ